jgi:hypothetical protein
LKTRQYNFKTPLPLSYLRHCKEVSVDRNTDTRTQTLQKVREGRKAGREAKAKSSKLREPTTNQGPCPDLRGTCIEAPDRKLVHFSPGAPAVPSIVAPVPGMAPAGTNVGPAMPPAPRPVDPGRELLGDPGTPEAPVSPAGMLWLAEVEAITVMTITPIGSPGRSMEQLGDRLCM